MLSLAPPRVAERTYYNLRNIQDFQIPHARTLRFRKSFLLSVINIWNGLHDAIKSQETLIGFKNTLQKHFYSMQNKLLLYGSGHGAINLARIRMGLSGLNQQRKKYHFIGQSNCPLCNQRVEDPIHYFLKCQHHAVHRRELFRGIASVLAPNVNYNLLEPTSLQDMKDYLHIIMYGSANASFENNCKIFDHVHYFITQTHRFM